LYFRLRPYWALPTVHPIGPRSGSSSFFSTHATLAAAVAVGALLIARRWGLASALLGLLVAVGQVMIGAHYPADVLTGLLVGGLAVVALAPLRRRLQRPLDRLLHTGRAPAVLRPQELRLGVVGLVLLVGLGGWLVARAQDHGLRIALNRADARLARHLPTDARLYRPASIESIANGWWRTPSARVNREPDGDVHVQLKAPDGSFVVLEIIPELPMAAPHDDNRITAWGIVRHDGLHNWWELHPLIGWAHGRVNAASTGGLDD
jgi:PAP2 superfamily